MALAKSLKDLIAEIEDTSHKQRIHKAYEDIRDAGTRLVKAASIGTCTLPAPRAASALSSLTACLCLAFESPTNKDLVAEVQNVGRELATKIGVAIAIAQPDGAPLCGALPFSSTCVASYRLSCAALSLPRSRAERSGRHLSERADGAHQRWR